MTKRRAIYGSAATSLSLARCCPEAQLLFDRLVALADDQGRLQGDPMLVKAQCMPLIDKATIKAVDRWLGELAEYGMVLRYETAGQPLVQIINWWGHQDWLRHVYASRWRAPVGWDQDRVKGNGAREDADDLPPPGGKLPPTEHQDAANEGQSSALSGVGGEVESEVEKEASASRGGDAREADPPPRAEPLDLSLHKITTTHTDLFQKPPNAKATKMYGDLLRNQAKGSLDAVLRAMYWCWNDNRDEYGFVKRVKDRLIERIAAA